MELAVGVFVGFLDPLHVLHDIQGGDQVDIQLGGVAYQAQNGMGLADAGVDGDTLLLEPGDQTLKLVTVGVVFQYDDHGVIPPKYNVGIRPGNEKRPAAGPAAGRDALTVSDNADLMRPRFQPNRNKPYRKSR